MTTRRTVHAPRSLRLVTATALVALTAACGTATTETATSAPQPIPRAEQVATATGPGPGEPTEESGRTPRLGITYDGGVMVLDATDLTLLGDFPLKGFTRLNPAGDQRHLFVSTGNSFRLLDLGSWSSKHGDHAHHHAQPPALTNLRYRTSHPGHVVVHDGRTVLYGDGDGTIRTIDPETLRDGVDRLPEGETTTEKTPHHGVAVERADGSMVTTVGTADERSGIRIHDAKGELVAASDECPGVHGEAAAKGGALVFGCEDGLLLVKGHTITKIDAPDAYGRIGNQAGSEQSPFVLGDYKTDPDAELERPTTVSLTDTRDGSLQLVELPASYSFRSLARGPEGEALVLGTDGTLRVIDPATGKVTESIAVTDSWKEPTEWQDPRPTVHVQGGTAYVTEPSTKALHMVDLHSGEVFHSGLLPQVPNEISGTLG